ncbi:MAG: oxygen-independent coproporphyrinogen III oxidase [Bacteriovoracaceae bacterium]|jgi:oxygen-independent coproporphyrinogen III oxidase|nr:oxygen-independent coproporphyrinogen III oxidase [Bacteriovoracaceae bacterium]
MKLLDKYNQQLPRYTSFPAHPHWNGSPTTVQWMNQLQETSRENNNLEIYIHIPYCESLCRFCACNKKITKNKEISKIYIDALLKEWKHYTDQNLDFQTTGIHLGGGTPTFLSPGELDLLFTELSKTMKFAPKFKGSIEIDPRVTVPGHLEVFEKHNFNHISLGIQDFDLAVQENISRIQPLELVADLVSKIRSRDGIFLNFDLIHGLPGQTPETIRDTFDKVIDLGPDTIAYYSYARVPWKSKAQSLLEKLKIPTGEEKKELFDIGKQALLANGFKELGFDHFAKPESELYKSKQSGTLKRNFMGYTVSNAEMLIGLGCSSISYSGLGYVQNEKNPDTYMEQIQKGEMPFITGHTHSELDIEIYKNIQELMCNGRSDLTETLSKMSTNLSGTVLAELNDMKTDGILDINNGVVEVKEIGIPYVRNICKALDYNLKDKKTPKNQFSSTI